MKKVTDLKENEVIHCTTEQEALLICKLMHDAGLKWGSGASWAEHNDFYYLKNEICYNPKKGQRIRLKEAKAEKYIIHPASDFLTPTYTVTREQLRNIANDNPIYFTECMAFANKRFHLLDEISYFSNDLVSTMFNEKWYDNELLKLLFPNYEKPKQKKEITVWVNVYSDSEVYTHMDEDTAVRHKGDSNKHVKTVEGKLTYEI